MNHAGKEGGEEHGRPADESDLQQIITPSLAML
jgi:hypothetical protein